MFSSYRGRSKPGVLQEKLSNQINAEGSCVFWREITLPKLAKVYSSASLKFKT